MNTIKLTIGMAVYDDFDGAYFTIQHLREQDSELLRNCELIVVDNNPTSRQGLRLKSFVEGWTRSDFGNVQYIPYTEKIGTAAPRDQVFRNATGTYVMCIDSHIILQRGALASLLAYYTLNPDTKDLLCGPMVYDDRRNFATHFTNVWRHGMWGVWGVDPRADIYSNEFNSTPFEIEAQGLGLFSCRKDRWIEVGGFNPDFSGFGGEEWYIHIKFRQHGGKVIMLPRLRWMHRFNEGQTYPRTNLQKVRNYVIGHRELGLPLDRIHRHFVMGLNEDGSSWDNDGSQPQGTDIQKANTLTELQWQALIAEPMRTAPEIEAALATCPTCPNQILNSSTLDQLFAHAASTPSDINEHCYVLRELASQSARVTEFGVRHGVSTTALLAGKDCKLISYDLVKYPEVSAFERVAPDRFRFVTGDSLNVEIEETDLLFIDTKHTAGHLAAELEKHHSKVTRWIVMHDTVIFGETGEDGGPGLLHAIRPFILAHPEWTVWRSFSNNNGLMVLSRDERDKKPLPSLVVQTWNYGKAIAKHAANGAAKVRDVDFQIRLDTCLLCPLLHDGKCSVCGCPVEDKALWASEVCPHPLGNQWPSLIANGE